VSSDPEIDFSKGSRLRSLGLYLAKPLSRMLTQPVLFKKVWLFEVYFEFLIGKGAGTGWDMREEIKASATVIYRPKPNVLDVGANVGRWSESFLSAYPAARIIMCEPNPTSQAQIRGRNLTTATLLPVAVGDKAGSAVLFSSRDCDGSASLHERVDTYFATREYEKIEVQTTTIDQIAQEHSLDFIDFIKMDIEGHELFALRGAQKCLAEKRIGGLLFEFGFGNINSRTFLKDFWDILGKDFYLYRVTPGGTPLRIHTYYEDLEYFRGATNYIAELKAHPYRCSSVTNS
jgi:FkbM family methyltransferase